MAEVAFFLSNPGHHATMLAPVAQRLEARGVASRVLSLCELRGLPSPEGPFAASRARVVALWPDWLPRRREVAGALGAQSSGRRRALRGAAWHGVLRPRIARELHGARVAVLPNDSAFPYDRIALALRRRSIPFVLVQEGIRFPLPIEGKDRYGLGGAAAIAAWGEGSAEHFRAIGVEASRIRVTGSPRFAARAPGGRARQAPTAQGPIRLLLVTNPIDAQGFCSTAGKIGLVADFVALLGPLLARGAATLTLRTHPGERMAEYAAALSAEDRGAVSFDADEGLDEALRRADLVVVMASTVGLEALERGLPLAVLPTPGHGHVFDYVERGVALGLELDPRLGEALLRHAESTPLREATVASYLEHHLASGDAAARIAELMIELLDHG